MRILNDTALHKGMRKKLVDIIRQKGIRDEKVLDAILSIPRHYFLDSVLDKYAYEDRAFPIGEGQTISQPYTVAYQTELLQVKPFDKILEIGTGSAYQAAVLGHLQAKVYTIERQKGLFEYRKAHFPLASRYPNIKFFYGDGFLGLPAYMPFDKILVTAAAPFVPQPLLNQLKPGAFLVIPVDEGEGQRMKRITKHADGSISEELFDYFRFVPMLEGKQNGNMY